MNPADPSPAPTSTPAPVRPRRRIWPWILGVALTPFVLVGLAAASLLTLDRDAAALRREAMAASGSDWDTKVQVSVGGLVLGAARSTLFFVRTPEVEDARLALAAVRHASVGVYERATPAGAVDRERLMVATDDRMRARGWTRLVGVAEKDETVLIYVSDDLDPDGPVELCLAVIGRRELVIVSTSVAPDALHDLVARHAGEELKTQFARLPIRKA